MTLTAKNNVASVMGYLKWMSSRMIFDRRVNLKYTFGNRRFWTEGCTRGSAVKLNRSRSWTGSRKRGLGQLMRKCSFPK